MATRVSRRGKLPTEGQDIAQMAKAIFDRVRDIKQGNPDIARKIDEQERSIRDSLTEIRRQIDMLDKQERDLVTLLVVQGIQKATEDVFSGA